MAVVTNRALAAGAGSLPQPVSDGDDDGWFVWRPIVQSSVFVIGASIQSQVYEIDSKAMRRVEDGYAIAIMFENNTTLVASTTGLVIATGISMLSSRS